MYRMMIVDDEERIANSIYDLMDERFDFELYRCYSAMAALDVIRTMRFDIVITDIAMPGMSGLELLNKVQAIWPKCHFLILTAYDSFDYAYETLRHDRVDYLLKIESYDTICQCVERKLQDIQKERSREEKLRHYDQYVQQVGESMGRYFLKRIIVQGIPLPDQHDLDQFSVPLRLEQPVMLVFLALNDQNPVTNNRTSMDILQSFRRVFRRMIFRFYPTCLQARSCWLFSPVEKAIWLATVLPMYRRRWRICPKPSKKKPAASWPFSARTRRFCGSRLIRCTSGQRCGWKTSAAKAA